MKGVPFHRVFAQARRWENVLSSSPLDLSRPLQIMKAAPPTAHFDRTLASIRDSPRGIYRFVSGEGQSAGGAGVRVQVQRGLTGDGRKRDGVYLG